MLVMKSYVRILFRKFQSQKLAILDPELPRLESYLESFKGRCPGEMMSAGSTLESYLESFKAQETVSIDGPEWC